MGLGLHLPTELLASGTSGPTPPVFQALPESRRAGAFHGSSSRRHSRCRGNPGCVGLTLRYPYLCKGA